VAAVAAVGPALGQNAASVHGSVVPFLALLAHSSRCGWVDRSLRNMVLLWLNASAR